MKKIVPGGIAGLLAAAVLAAPALAAPANVAVRVEGATQTLTPRTTVTTSNEGAGKDGKTCPGTTALGALDLATAGDWSGSYFDSLSSWFVETIKGETHASVDAGYWALWINDIHSDVGACGAELQEGDSMLFVPDNAGPILELSGVPSTAAPGQSITATVTEHGFTTNPDFSTTTSSHPAVGATVSYGGASVTTGADGTARLTVSTAGPVSIRATQPGRVRSATAITCVTTGNDGNCGSQLPAGAVLGTGKAADKTAPKATLSGLRNGKVFKHGKGPRVLKGAVTPDPSGLSAVRLSIVRKVGKRCWAYDGTTERFDRHRCGGWKYFKIGDRNDWSYLLPKRLTQGRYTIKVAATDKSANRSESQVVIRVR